MGKWSDVIALIATTEETNERGFYLPPTETRREVFCNKKSVGFKEFYTSAQAGMVTELKFIVRADEYGGESVAEHEGKRYKVTRNYDTTAIGGARSGSGEFVELTVTDLAAREAEPDGGGGDG